MVEKHIVQRQYIMKPETAPGKLEVGDIDLLTLEGLLRDAIPLAGYRSRRDITYTDVDLQNSSGCWKKTILDVPMQLTVGPDLMPRVTKYAVTAQNSEYALNVILANTNNGEIDVDISCSTEFCAAQAAGRMAGAAAYVETAFGVVLQAYTPHTAAVRKQQLSKENNDEKTRPGFVRIVP